MTTPIRAVGIKGAVDSLVNIRLGQPLAALSREEDYEFNIQRGSFDLEWGDQKGIFISYRLHPETGDIWKNIDQKCREGWIWVHDVDDNPRFLGGQKRHKYRSIACAHIVTVTSVELARICREFNRNVFVFPNQIGLLPPKELAIRSNQDPRILFGAINRSGEWGEGLDFVVDSLVEHGDHIELFVINDDGFSKRFKDPFPLRHLPHQSYADYIKLIDHMDIVLVPLQENVFNRSKSDLKIIEAFAHGMVPIVSRFAAEMSTVPNELLMIVDRPEDWSAHLNTLLDDPEKLPEIKARGYDYVVANRLWAEHVFELHNIYQEAMKDWARLEEERQLRISIRQELGLPA